MQLSHYNPPPQPTQHDGECWSDTNETRDVRIDAPRATFTVTGNSCERSVTSARTIKIGGEEWRLDGLFSTDAEESSSEQRWRKMKIANCKPSDVIRRVIAHSHSKYWPLCENHELSWKYLFLFCSIGDRVGWRAGCSTPLYLWCFWIQSLQKCFSVCLYDQQHIAHPCCPSLLVAD